MFLTIAGAILVACGILGAFAFIARIAGFISDSRAKTAYYSRKSEYRPVGGWKYKI